MSLPFDFKNYLVVLSLILLACNSANVEEPSKIPADLSSQKTFFVYENNFAPDEKMKLENWITTVSEAAQKILGRYPFDLYYYFHRNENPEAAVSFAYTVRSDTMHAAHFVVNPDFSPDDFMHDWMAPHEICHLALPRLPETDLWFYEGFATYLSRQVMIETGIYKPSEVDSINHKRIADVKNQFDTNSKLSFVADSLISNHRYAAVYWIGASYFLSADAKLNALGKMNFCEVIYEFQSCCHKSKMSIKEILVAWNDISKSTTFTDLFDSYTNTPCYQLITDYQ